MQAMVEDIITLADENTVISVEEIDGQGIYAIISPAGASVDHGSEYNKLAEAK